MFEPKFSYTDEIVRNLTLIAEARAIILNAPLVPKWEVSLRREALLKSAHFSTAIEGNLLSFDDVLALASGKDIMVRRKDKQEVLNYIEALENIPEFAKRIPLIDKDILKLHKVISNKTLENPGDEGVFRNRQVAVGNRTTGEVVFMPPPTEHVSRLVNNFLEWLNSEEVNKVDPVIEAGITHYEIVRIHPFIDGNGRTARVMASMVLYKRGFDIKRFFALDDYYDRDRRSYYEALESVDQNTLNLTTWLEYFTHGVAVSTKEVRDKVIGLSKDVKFLKKQGQVALTERQMKIVEMLIQKDKVSVSDIASEFGISRQAALKKINKLVDLGVVKLEGMGRGAHYILI